MAKLRTRNHKVVLARSAGGDAGITVLLVILGVFMFLPMLYVIMQSLKPLDELWMYPPRFIVTSPTPKNFRDLFTLMNISWVPFSRYVWNSVFVTVVVTVAQCIVASMAAFVLAKCKFPGNGIINKIIVISLLYNSNVIYIMQYMVMSELNLINTTRALILPSIASAMGLFLMRQSMSQVPDAMIEAAKVDGANMFTTCWRIVIPNQKPALMTMSIFAFQGAWNIQGGSLVYDEAKKTLPTVVQQAASAGLARAGVAMAAAVFMLIPPVVFFMLAQKNVIETMAHSGIKD